MKNYNKQQQMYCFILLFNLFNSLTTDFTVTGSGTLILRNVQLTMLERFSAILAIYKYQYMMLYRITQTEKCENTNFFEKKSDLNQKIQFFIFLNHYFSNAVFESVPCCNCLHIHMLLLSMATALLDVLRPSMALATTTALFLLNMYN